MRVALCQINPIVGDVDGNVGKMHSIFESVAPSADLVVFSELAVTGYPPRDLLEKHGFRERTARGVERLVAASASNPATGMLFGAPMPSDRLAGQSVFNSAILAHDGRIAAVRHKSLLPSYDVFDETRYFERATSVEPIAFGGETLGVMVCEDAWSDPEFWPGHALYAFDPVAELARQGATLLVNLSASPFSVGKDGTRFRLIAKHARRHGLPFVYVNQVGGNDELVFDGRSMAVDARGELLHVSAAFGESVDIVDTAAAGSGRYDAQPAAGAIYDALVLGTRDYLHKCGFTKAALGLSGGIDSAVTCCIAADALGAENVTGVAMPSKYNLEGSTSYSRELAQNLGVEFHVVPIDGVYRPYAEVFKGLFGAKTEDGVTFENIQARIRGNILMAFSNNRGCLVLTTGNKSELAVGYCTLYGDMCGGLAVIADVPKTAIYELARHINRERTVIPQWIIDRAPSAELRANQTDQDTLPPYDVLDAVLTAYIEEGRSVAEIAATGVDRAVVEWVICAVNRTEYKRRQAAPGLRVTSKAFGVGRRIPIAAKCEV